jgi:ABC-2 type transport system ATP-binding protein
VIDWSQYGELVSQDGGQVRLRLPKADASRITARLLAEQVIDDLTVEDPPVEDVIDQVFSQEHA